ncbi:unnamed protein product [Mesocestoides corti]|uniref:HTH psq-type domain-containing protein n=1 Tax=Mesocestoides corti TaxID=53468 RepID=A0A0R3U2C9_MESCO|nr:unnamed protein product [Mesocestoides corti]
MAKRVGLPKSTVHHDISAPVNAFFKHQKRANVNTYLLLNPPPTPPLAASRVLKKDPCILPVLCEGLEGKEAKSGNSVHEMWTRLPFSENIAAPLHVVTRTGVLSRKGHKKEVVAELAYDQLTGLPRPSLLSLSTQRCSKMFCQ